MISLQTLLFGKSERRRKKAVSSIIGGVLIFGIIFSVGFSYFYTTSQDQQVLQMAQKQNNDLSTLKNQESMYVQSNLTSEGNITFTLHNTGISTDLVAYFITDQTGKLLQYLNGTISSTASVKACYSNQTSQLPCELDPGAAAYVMPSPEITYVDGNTYTIKFVTSRGSTFVGTYPTQEITTSSLNTLVASGLGSLEMVFSSFNFYSYSETGGPWQINLGSAQSAAVTPYSKGIAFSMQITNNDPRAGTIVVDSHTDLWTFLSCGSGCGSQSLLAFYVMNVGSDGTISSTNQGSFVPIQIPYEATKTIYFGCSYDTSLNSCFGGSSSAQAITDAMSEHDVFLIFSGTEVSAENSTLYSQNLPFAATFTSDNIATFSQTPTTCGNGSSATFTLSVTNTAWSPSGDDINQVQVQAASFNPPTSQPVTSGWSAVVNSGTITWTGGTIAPGQTQTFTWTGTAPYVSTGTEEVFISTVGWNAGTITSQLIDTGCYVG